jgi:hypothetical protein
MSWAEKIEETAKPMPPKDWRQMVAFCMIGGAAFTLPFLLGWAVSQNDKRGGDRGR